MSLKPESKGYLVDTFSAFSPWSSRSTTPKPGEDQQHGQNAKDSESASRKGGDHRLNPRKKISLKSYPPDCPPPTIQWYHAVDIPKRKPNYAQPASTSEKPPPPPKKWLAFSTKDSRAIEAAFQSIPSEEDGTRNDPNTLGSDVVYGAQIDANTRIASSGKHPRSDGEPNTSMDAISGGDEGSATKVPVNEDYLFDVDIERRELGPAYWLGPIYEVRRGSWFYLEGTALRPCDENLALQLEEGYLKTTPWRAQVDTKDVDQTPKATISPALTLSEVKKLMSNKSAVDEKLPITSAQPMPMAVRLFGAHMNTVVQYQDASTAYLLSDDFFSRMSSTVYQRFAGGAHLSGTKVVRGFSDMAKKKTVQIPKRSESPTGAETKPEASPERPIDAATRDSAPSSDHSTQDAKLDESTGIAVIPEPESALMRLERRMTALMVSNQPEDAAKQDEEAQKLEEKEIRDDYRDTSGEKQDREIEHLVLVTHGIGQRLGQRFETFNFIHNVNEFRKLIKSVYSSSPDLQALNAEVDKLPQNCRIQVLPICWRHLLDFPHQSLKHNRKEFDLADIDDAGEEVYPGLQEITVEGVPALRNIIADLALDILLYQTPAYKGHISRIVVQECNRIFKLFQRRNPYFQGKVSLCGHSLGSALFFDILSEQVDESYTLDRVKGSHPKSPTSLKLDFDVQSLFLLGSPVGLFQMLQGKTIEGRQNSNKVTLNDSTDDPDSLFASRAAQPLRSSQRSTIASSPKCRQLYNIFHPTDPIAYRLEPLISPSMSKLSPQNLPYVKKSFLGAPMGQGLTGIPAMVGQSVSDLWSNLSSGLADRFIHRSLGISAEDAARLGAPMAVPEAAAKRTPPARTSPGAGTNIVGGGVISTQDSVLRRLSHGGLQGGGSASGHRATLLDTEIDTLYAGFQKGLHGHEGSDAGEVSANEAGMAQWMDAEERGRKLKREEGKVRALNSNGRVDYGIQEGAFEISFLGSIASHLAYWTDEDVCHFVSSQLLSPAQRPGDAAARHRKTRSLG